VVNVKAVKQSTSFGTLLTFAVALIAWGVGGLQANTGLWYVNVIAVGLGLAMVILDTYVLKGQASQ